MEGTFGGAFVVNGRLAVVTVAGLDAFGTALAAVVGVRVLALVVIGPARDELGRLTEELNALLLI